MDARENASVDPKTYFVDTELEESEPRESLAPLETVMAATEPEEIGVEHLLRDVRDKTAPTLAKKVQSRDEAKSDFAGKLEAITDYLRQVETGEMPRNEKICALVRDLFNDAVNSEKDQSFVDV
ncbi:26S proteasome non-ATPase regulatory subunit 7 [Bonamia ostreae]|uniref:26S proteasome non-ATPase regulatory subunit 7 n=1 Tax=Bonamia ostreae TaxID=126728 RepID=A0ABV2AJY6_9EUKA